MQSFCEGDPSRIKAVKELSWEEYWMWLDNEVRRRTPKRKK
ncbi:MAG: hypothetical protein RLN82_09605 [Pseudomonadales bacterium]